MGVASYAGVPRYRKRHPHASIESRVIDTPQSAINLDSGLVRPSESRMYSWWLDNGHPALEWSLSKGTKKSLVAKHEEMGYIGANAVKPSIIIC